MNASVNSSALDYTQSILPILWKFLDNCKHCSISMNIAMIDDELIVSIINKKKIRRFKNPNSQELIKKLKAYLRIY